MKTRCSHKKLEFQRFSPNDFCTARYERKSLKKKFQTFQKPRQRQFMGRSWPKIGPWIVFFGVVEKFETFFSKICAHSERYKNRLASIFEILTFCGNIAFPIVTGLTDVLQYFYELILYRWNSQLTFTIQTVVLTADVFLLQKYIFSEEVEKRQLWVRPVWMVETQFCKLRGTSDTFV